MDVLAEITLVNNPKKDEIIEEIQEITNLGIDGEISFTESLERRIKLLHAHKSNLDELIKRLGQQVSKSIEANKEFFESFSDDIYVISCGFKEFIEAIVKEYNIPANRVYANTFEYDADGNMTKGYTSEGYRFTATYDAENQLKKLVYKDSSGITHKILYVFNAAKLLVRVKSYQNNVLTDDLRIIRAGFLALQDRDQNNNIIRKYTWGQNAGGGIGGLLSMQQSGAKYYYHYDGRGNVTAVTDSQQQVVAQYLYDEYGQVNNQSATLDQPFKFSTKRYDSATGMIYFGYRYYIPEIQKWLTRDPIGENGGMNLYGYVGSNPIGRIDPYGLEIKVHGTPTFKRKVHKALNEIRKGKDGEAVYNSLQDSEMVHDIVERQNRGNRCVPNPE